ncbi:MAG: gamma-glutamylcyclotransferase family protein [Pseudomonadales bacterium]
MKVFFYGLFMDTDLLSRKGITPLDTVIAHVDGFSLRIGERATLQRKAGAQAYGVIMEISPDEAKGLYSESSVADYIAEPVVANLSNGNEVEAQCYNLPEEKITGTNQAYADALLKLSQKIGLPGPYLAEIKQAGE